MPELIAAFGAFTQEHRWCGSTSPLLFPTPLGGVPTTSHITSARR
jgi:hypothetical protein